MPNVFISYAREDRALCEELIEHLGWLRHSGNLDVFDDFQIKPMSDWNAEIVKKLSDADLVICLISAAFVGSKYCTINEMSKAIENNTPIMSVILREVDFEALPVSKFQALPVDAKGRLRPISRWRGRTGRDQAWSRIAQSVRIAMSQIAVKENESKNDRIAQKDGQQDADERAEELEHIWWTIDETYRRVEESIGKIPLVYYVSKTALAIPALKLEIDRATLDLREYALREQGEDREGSFFVYGAFEITFLGERFISLRSYFRMFFGGAHSNYEYRAITFDLLTRKCIGLGDLLRTRSRYDAVVQLVGMGVSAERQRRSAEHISVSGDTWLPCRPEDLCFCLVGAADQPHTLQYVKIMFAPYEIGSFAEGRYEIDMPAVSMVEISTPLFREICNLPPANIEGSYNRPNEFSPAYIRITKTNGEDMYHIKGEAYWGASRFYGPNTGQIDFVAKFDGREIFYNERIGEKDYRCQIKVYNSSIDVEETYGMQGHNVTFTGKYSREIVDESDDGDLDEIKESVKKKEDFGRSIWQRIRGYFR